MDKKIAVVGAGLGFVLARYLAKKYFDNEIGLYDKDKKLIGHLKRKREHPLHFKGYTLPENVKVSGDSREIIRDSDILIIAVPTQHVREMARETREYIKKDAILLNVAKGIEMGTGKRISEILREELKDNFKYAVLSGGMIAQDLVKEDPLSAEIASRDDRITLCLQDIMSSGVLRIYRNNDVVGVEYAGALKNPLSIGAGIAKGLGYGDSTMGALISRGGLEIERLAIKLGAKKETFALGGLAGIGDMITSCLGGTRNRRFGELIGRGTSVEETLKIFKEKHELVEGYYTVKSIRQLADRAGVEMPIQAQVFQILYEGKSPVEALKELMNRELK